MKLPGGRRGLALVCLAILTLSTLPVVSLAENGKVKSQATAFERDEEIILINRNDGQIVIRDTVPPSTSNYVNLDGKYSSWGGSWFAVAAGDVDGDGFKEIAAIGGRAVNQEGPWLKVFDPVAERSSQPGPRQEISNVGDQNWQKVACADVDGDGKDEIIAVRSDGAGMARLHVFKYNSGGNTWYELTSSVSMQGGIDDMTVGDLNGDNKPDVAIARIIVDPGNTSRTIKSQIVAYRGDQLSTVIFDKEFCAPCDMMPQPWKRIRIANLDDSGGNEFVWMRREPAISGNKPEAIVPVRLTGINTWNDMLSFTYDSQTCYGYAMSPAPDDIEIADVNGDGKPRILAYVRDAGGRARITIYNPRRVGEGLAGMNEGDWYSAPSGTFLIGDTNLVVGDINGDGSAEAMFLEDTSKNLRVVFNGSVQTTDGFNGPFSNNFITANLDGTGAIKGPRMVVPSSVVLYYIIDSDSTTSSLVKVANAGSDTFTWTATENPAVNWLNLSATSGVADATFTMTLDKTQLPSLAPGATTQTAVRVLGSGSNLQNGDQTITVTAIVVQHLYQSISPMTFR